MDSTQRTARLAGLLYLLSSLPGAFALLYVPGKVIVKGDGAATAERLRTYGGLVRTGIAAELLSSILFVFVALVLYRLFEPVSKGPALAMMVLILLSFPISLAGVVNEVAALNLAGAGDAGGFLSAVDTHERDAMAYLFLRLHSQTIFVAELFWGLWLFPFGVCVMRSGFIPRVLGVLLMVAGCSYVAVGFAELALPRSAQAIGRVAGILTLAEVPIIFWLLIWGAKPQRTTAIGFRATE